MDFQWCERRTQVTAYTSTKSSVGDIEGTGTSRTATPWLMPRPLIPLKAMLSHEREPSANACMAFGGAVMVIVETWS
jgi:hypothetical protein